MGETTFFNLHFFCYTLTSLPITETGQTDRQTDGQRQRIKPPLIKNKQIPCCLSPRQDRQTDGQRQRIKPPSVKYKQIPCCLSLRQDRQTDGRTDRRTNRQTAGMCFFVTVTCPCSSTTKCHVNLFVYNNNNNDDDGQRQRIKPPSLKYKQIPRCLSLRRQRALHGLFATAEFLVR